MSTQPPTPKLPPRRKRSKVTPEDAARIRDAWMDLERAWSILRMLHRVDPTGRNAIASICVLAFAALYQFDEAMENLDDALATVLVQP
ncbi:MAG TPA: hypothetical protein VFF06_18155 [Polyangia bacterium]|nr:hypothetical protein [Polyangia bacterium]